MYWANVAKPTMTPARWATSTGPDELTARSTSGSALERSHRTHHQARAAAAATRPSTLGEVQPQLEPFVMPSSSTNSVLASTTAPGRSKRAGNLVAAPRVLATTATKASTQRPPVTQNTDCHPWADSTLPITTGPSPAPSPAPAAVTTATARLR